MENFMKKKLLCMLLSIAMVSTAAESLVQATETPTELQTTIEETQEETSASQESTTVQAESEQEFVSEQEPTEPETSKDTEISTELEEKESISESETVTKETETETDQESTASETETESDQESTASETETESDQETTELETEETAGSKSQNTEGKTDLQETDTKLQVKYHSIDEIKEFLIQEKIDKSDAVTYTEKPNLAAPYHAGALSDATLDSAAAMIHQIRFIAGLPYETAFNDEYNHLSQAAALLSYVNHELSQKPSQPEGMSEELFQQGCDGVSNSILAYTDEPSQTLNQTIVDIWLGDNDEHNMRGQVLHPSTEQIGFGAVKGSNGMYSAMYTADRSGKDETVFGIAWPAQNMPIDYFDKDYPWSVSTGEMLKASDIRVTLTRKSDGNEWTFSEETSDGLFSVDNDNCGQSGCIVFRPETSEISEYKDGDIFEVEITKEEKPYLSYRVQFFSFSEEEEKLTAPEASIATGEAVVKDTKLVLTNKESASVYYTLDGTTPTSDSTMYTEPISIESDVTVKVIAIKDGYEDSDIAAFTYTVDEDIPVRYTVTFESNGGTIVPAQSISENEKVIIPENPTKEDFFFDDWYQEAECENKWDFETNTITQDTTLYAKWNETPPETYCTVSFDMQGLGDQIDPVTINAGETLTEPESPTAEEYLFEGWYQEAECLNIWDFETNAVESDITLYAKWNNAEEGTTEAITTYIVTYDMQCIGEQIEPTTINEGETLAKPDTPTAEGYIFDDWYQEAECINLWDFETETITQDTVLYAKWVQGNAAEIRINTLETAESNGIELTTSNTKISNIKTKTYDGKQYLPVVKVSIKDGTKWAALTEGVDYAISYKDNTNAGTGKVNIKGIGAYSGEVTKEFTIKKKAISKLKVIMGSLTVGSKSAPPVWIYDGNKQLRSGTDFSLEYDSNLTQKKTTAGKVKIIAAENSNYSGAITKKITVYELKDSEMLINPKDVQFQPRSTAYTGKAITSIVPTVTVKGVLLKKNKDYKLQYQNNTNAGTAYIIVTGKGKYKGKVVGTFTITPVSDAVLDIKAIPEKTYNGKLQKPAVTVKVGKKTLKLNRDYIVSYGKNLNATTGASVTVSGIGNYQGAKKSTNFVIKPQKISKASIQGSMTSGVTLTYNKRLLQQGKDYNAPVYVKVKGTAVSVKITGKGNFTGETTKSTKVDVPASKMTPVPSANKNAQNYGSFEGSEVNSYLVKTSDAFMRVEHIGGKGVYAETYNTDKTLRSRKYLKMELPKFGGFYEGTNYYFLAFGQRNPDKNNGMEVLRIVKYDKNWKRKGAVSLYGANTLDPFKNGSLRMVQYDDILYVRSCHQMYNTHQANISLCIQISNMELTQELTGVYNLGWNGYVSHSFNQFVLTDGSDLLAVDHGDAYPRSVVMIRYSNKAGNPSAFGGNQSVSVLPIPGSGAYTGVSVGGFETSNTAYLTAGNSVELTPSTFNTGGVRNIFVTSTLKDNFTKEGNNIHWITNYKNKNEASVTTPHLVKISGSEFMVLWGEGAQVKCVLLNAAGEPTTGIYSYDGALSDCKPIVDDGKLIWYYTNGNAPVFCELNISDVRSRSK